MTASSEETISMWPAVERNAASAEFFDAAARGELLVQSGPTGVVLGPEVRTCPETGSADLTKIVASGRGSLVTWVVVHQAPIPALARAVPYVSAVVELIEGPWLMVRLVDVDGVQLRVGMPVEVSFVQSGDSHGEITYEMLPVFAPATSTDGHG